MIFVGPLWPGSEVEEYGHGGGWMVLVTGGWLTPICDLGFGLSIMVKFGGWMLLVTYIIDVMTTTPPVVVALVTEGELGMYTFQKLMEVITTI